MGDNENIKIHILTYTCNFFYKVNQQNILPGPSYSFPFSSELILLLFLSEN